MPANPGTEFRLPILLTTALGGLVVLSAATVLAMLATKTVPSLTLNLFGVEQNGVFAVQRILLEGRLYTDPAAFPFIVIQYPPLYPALLAMLCKVAGIAPDAPHAIVALGRMTSLTFGALGGAVIAAHLIRTHRVPVVAGIATGALVVVALFPSGFSTRPDSAYLFLLLAALACCPVRACARPLPWLVGAQLLLVVALFTKQTAIAFLWLPAAIALFLTGGPITVRLGRATALAIVAVVTIAVGLAASPGLWANSATGLANGRSVHEAIEKTWLPFAANWGFLVAVAVACGLYAAMERARDLLPLAVAAALTFVIATALSLKIGSRPNYYNEFLATGLALSTASLTMLCRRLGRRALPAAAGLGLLAFTIPWMVFVDSQPRVLLRAVDATGVPRPYQGLLEHAVADRGGIIAMDLDASVKVPTRIAVATVDVLGQAYAAGAYSLSPVAASIRRGEVRWLLMSAEMLEMAKAPVLAARRSDEQPQAALAAALLPLFEPYREADGWFLYRAREAGGG